LIVLIGKLETRTEVVIASVVGLTSFITRNITIAILSGILLEYALNFAQSRMTAIKGEKP